MHDAAKIVAGSSLAAVMTSPFWYNALTAAPAAVPALAPPPNGSKEWRRARAYMRANHMDLLNEWRDLVVRAGQRDYVSTTNGRAFDMSLSRTCLDCHSNRPSSATVATPSWRSIHPAGTATWSRRRRRDGRFATGIPHDRRAVGWWGPRAARPWSRPSASGDGGGGSHRRSAGQRSPAGDGDRPAEVRPRRRTRRALHPGLPQGAQRPDFGADRKNEIKWIWAEDFESTFRDEEFRYLRRDLQGKPTLAAVQPLRQPAVHPGLSDESNLEATRRRHRDDGLAPMHRLPLLHRGLPLRVAELQLERSAAAPRKPHATSRPGRAVWSRSAPSGEELLARGGQPACVEACADDEIVFGDLNDPGSKVRRLLTEHLAIRRQPDLGTRPEVY